MASDAVAGPRPLLPDGQLYTPLLQSLLFAGVRCRISTDPSAHAAYRSIDAMSSIDWPFTEAGFGSWGRLLGMRRLPRWKQRCCWRGCFVAKHTAASFRHVLNGMPETDAGRDLHKRGTSPTPRLRSVQARPFPKLVTIPQRAHSGNVRRTGRKIEIAFAHVDVDIYAAVARASEFIYPRVRPGGLIGVAGDYGFQSYQGARMAVDESFSQPDCLPVGPANGASDRIQVVT